MRSSLGSICVFDSARQNLTPGKSNNSPFMKKVKGSWLTKMFNLG